MTRVSGDSTLGGHAQSSVCIRTQEREQWPHGRLNQTYLLVLEGLLQSQGVAVAHGGDRDTGSRSSGKYSLAWARPESAISPTKEPGRLQCWVASGQTTNREGTQTHPSAVKRIKVLLSSAHQSNAQLYPPPVPPHQEACTSLLDSLIHQRADSRSKKNYKTAACGTKTTFTERQTKWKGIRLCTRWRNKIKPQKNN